MNREFLKRALVVLILVVVVSRLCLSWIVGGMIRGAVAEALPHAKVSLGTPRLNLWKGSVEVRNAKITKLFKGAEDVEVSAKRIYVSVRIGSLFGGGEKPIIVKKVTIVSPRILIDGNADSPTNLEELLLAGMDPQEILTMASGSEPDWEEAGTAPGDTAQKRAKGKKTKKVEAPPPRFIVHTFDLTGGHVAYRENGMTYSVDIPDMHVTDMGADQEGLTALEIAGTLLVHLIAYVVVGF